MDVFSLLEEIQTIARNGLYFSENHYDRERYERLLALAAKKYEDNLNLPSTEVIKTFQKELGYITPKVGADAAIFDEEDRILLMSRADGSGWCLPCGWVEQNETPAQAAIREVKEETGLHVGIACLVGVFTRFANTRHGPHSIVAVVHLCEVESGHLTLSAEGLDLQYWSIADVPAWHANHEKYALAALQCRRQGRSWQPISD